MRLSNRAPFSVLMATYHGEHPDRLAASLSSLAAQTLPPAEIVLVFDGHVGADQETAIESFTRDHAGLALRIVRLPQHTGLAGALNAGLFECRQPYIARMDSDDISLPDRFALQWEMLLAHPELDLVAGWQAEFDEEPTATARIKTTPANHEAIARGLTWRCVISHPTVVIRRDLLRAVGGYRGIPYLEDYDLYMRLLSTGASFQAIQQPLVRVRVTKAQYRRRGGLEHLRAEWSFRWDCYRRGNLTLSQLALTIVAYSAFRLLPASIRSATYPFVRIL